MAQSLSSQLGQLQHQQKQYASLLYTQQVSAKTDLDTIYYQGCKGMNKLTQIDTRFSRFQESLFNVQNKGITRQLQTKQQNADLDKEIRQCLLLMSQYWTFEGTHSAMEYLLRNYRVHEYLVDEVIIYFLVYHNTKLYVRLLQNLVDQQRNSMWAFLYEPISRGQTIPRDLLIRQMQLDYRILKKIIDYQCLLLQKVEVQEEIVFTVQDYLYTEQEIQNIKLRQPNQLAFLYSILQDLKVTTGYMDQLRGSFGKLLALCIENCTDENKSFAYLIFNLQLFDPTKILLTENQIENTAQWIYSQVQHNDNLLDLAILFYQFGIKTTYETSLILLSKDLSKFFNNGLLLIEIIKQLKDIQIPEKQLHQLIFYLKHQLSKNDTHFLDSIVSIMHDQIITVVRPYLQDTQYKHLFPKSNQIHLTFNNSEQVIKQLNQKDADLSIGTLVNLIEDSYNYFIKSKKIQFIKILNQSLQIAETQFPQTVMFNTNKLYALINNISDQTDNRDLIQSLLPIFTYTHTKQVDANYYESLLLLNVHFQIETINEFSKSNKILKQVSNKEQLIKLIQQQDEKLIESLLYNNQVQKLLIYKQLQIQLSYILQDEQKLQKFINEYTEDDQFIAKTMQSLSIIQLLNLENSLCIKFIKSIEIDPQLFFNTELNHLGSLKILLHKSSRNVNFAFKLFLIYDDLTVEQQELYLQIAAELKESFKSDLKIQKIQFSQSLLQQTIGSLIKNRKEANFTKTLGNLKDQNALLDLQTLYLENFNDLRYRQLRSICSTFTKTKQSIKQDKVISLIKFIETNFKYDLLQSYLNILKYYGSIKDQNEEIDFSFLKKTLFKLPKDYCAVINEYISQANLFSAEVRTQMIIYVFSHNLKNKQIVVQDDLDFDLIISLLETPNLDILTHLVDLLRANIQHITVESIRKCFKLNINQPAQIILISQILYDYLDHHQINLLEECSSLQKKVLDQNLDLSLQINYTATTSCIRLIAKHTQINKCKSAFKSLTYPDIATYGQHNSLLFYRIIIEQFQNHNIKYFNSCIFAYFISQLIQITSTMDVNQEILQNFGLFSLEQWWVIMYILSTYYFTSEYIKLFKEQVNKFSPQIKLHISTALAESLFYRTQRHQKLLQIKLNQKLTQLQTPNLESCIKKVGFSLRGQIKPIKIKLSLLRILELVEDLQAQLSNYLIQSDLNAKQADQLKSLIVHISKFSNVFAHSKLKALSERVRTSLIHSMKIETLVPLIKNCISIKSVSHILLQAFNDILRLDLIKIQKQQIQLIRDLISQIIIEISLPTPNLSTEMLLLLNYLYSIQFIQKQLQQQGQEIMSVLIKLLDSQNEQDQSLILNLYSLLSQIDSYPYLNDLNQVFNMLITLLCKEENIKKLDNNQFTYNTEQIIHKVSNKLILLNTSYALIKSFKGLISKQHLTDISVLYLIESDKQGFQCILDNIENRVHLDVYINSILNQARKLKPFVVFNCVEYIAQLISKCESELVSEQLMQLNKEVQSIFDYSREQYIDSELKNGIFEADKLEYQINQVYIEIVMKINDVSFKKLYSNLIAWSRKQIQEVGYNFNKYRRIQFFRLSTQTSDKLGKYFTKYYSYIWDAIVNELQTFHNIFYETPKQTKLQKRTNDECDMYYRLELLLNRHILQSISSLCQNDCEQFVDTEKFEKLSDPLALTLDCPKVQQYESILQYIDEWITPTILALFQLINDDYKWKDLHLKILQVISRHSNKKNETSSFIIIAIIKLIHRLIDQLDERYLVLMNDLIPYLHQLTSTNLNSEELEKRVKQLIVRLSQLSGEDIVTALK
ncbi:unnamed protein product (macronuclear) [Paramecium tetraurelia]|uniref:HEAT repeat-containing protein 1 n=1 Tax=Paramecium tetraurelia TaxID=5888 RepID=A0CWQ5_PARTE|nr:uncharacterized protein GSPATT00001425001 [Paramecium tetraurelia]CAK75222.1 unnamed protein product [Paramecium tetraurelia]|eukprot:XP_001442619.1 hypothetical protein (macronuclear) [Paramecium tetraurelia strain d4-2]